jgi:hypothetical protein
MSKPAATVTRRAIIQRINRKLAPYEEKLVKARGARTKQDFGDYYTVHLRFNAILRMDPDLEDLAKEVGALKPWEHVEEE